MEQILERLAQKRKALLSRRFGVKSELDKIDRQIGDIRATERVLSQEIQEIEAERQVEPGKRPPGQKLVYGQKKQTVLAILATAPSPGIRGRQIMDQAKEKGIEISWGTLSSMLRRLIETGEVRRVDNLWSLVSGTEEEPDEPQSVTSERETPARQDVGRGDGTGEGSAVAM